MDIAKWTLILTVLTIVVAMLIGIPQVWYARISARLSKQNDDSISHEHIDLLEQIRNKKSIKIGFLHSPPFVVAPTPETPEATGLYVDLIQSFLRSEHITPCFGQTRPSAAVSSILSGEFDIVLSIFQTPRRSTLVDFTAFLHSVSVSGVVRSQESRVHAPADIVPLNMTCVVCRDEIGHEVLEDHLRIPANRIKVLDTDNISDILALVAAKYADIAIADGLSCTEGLAERFADKPKLKPVLRRYPIYRCPNGIMILKHQKPLAEWLDRGLKKTLRQPAFVNLEKSILDEYSAVIVKL